MLESILELSWMRADQQRHNSSRPRRITELLRPVMRWRALMAALLLALSTSAEAGLAIALLPIANVW
ncbi:hypothetical protein SynA1560_02451 [Synechococcus sp. A15-60]|nr:hypothetical protein SynA1560_02451 [Synechococcus sp. A15-60]